MPDDGQTQRERTQRGRERLPNLSQFYGNRLSDYRPGDFRFSYTLVHPGPNENITDRVLDVSWEDASSVLAGSIMVRRTRPDAFTSVALNRGNQIRCEFEWRDRRFEAWTMRLTGEPVIDPIAGSISATLANDLDNLARNEREWEFKDLRAHEIANKVANREGCPVGWLAKGEKKQKKLKMKGSGLDVIRKAYREEKEETGIRYVIRFRDGRLDIRPFERPSILYEIDDVEEAASLAGTPKHEKPRTIIEGVGRMKGKGKIEVKLAAEQLIERFGRSTLHKNFGRVESKDELRKLCERELARQIEVKHTASITMPGVPFIGRGSTLLWRTKEPGWTGDSLRSRDRRYCYVRSVSHSAPGDGRYTMTMEVVQEDPYLADKRRRDQEARDERHGGGGGGNGGGGGGGGGGG